MPDSQRPSAAARGLCAALGEKEMSFWKRLLLDVTGQANKRLPRQMALLGAAGDLVEQASRLRDEEQEEAFIRFVLERHGCMLDWKAKRDDVFEELIPLLSPQEIQALPNRSECPDDPVGTVEKLRQAISRYGRTLIQTESLGDFSFLLLVPTEKEKEFVSVVGPWLIRASKLTV